MPVNTRRSWVELKQGLKRGVASTLGSDASES